MCCMYSNSKYVGSDVSTAEDSTPSRKRVARGPSQRMRAELKSVSKEMSRDDDERAMVDTVTVRWGIDVRR